MEDFIMYEKYLEQLEEAGKIRNLKERSINCYKNYVSYFLKYQNKNPEELTCQDVRTFLLAKKEEGLKATTLNLYNSAIRFFYRNVLHILWDDITVPRMILEHKLPTVLTASEIDRLLSAVDDIGINNPFSKILIIILPGGVTHAVAGFCIAAIIIPTIPTTLLNVKKPPFIFLLIIITSSLNTDLSLTFYHILSQNSILRLPKSSLPTALSGSPGKSFVNTSCWHLLHLSLFF